MGKSAYVGIAVAVAFSGFAFKFFFKPHQLHQPSRLLTAHELALYNGTDQQLPIFLGILGDASRAFVSGNFTGDGLTDTLHGLSSSEVKSVVEWRDFFIRTYKFVGKLVGRYYDYQGKPTKYLKAAEAKAARGAQLLEKQKKEEEKIPNCNSKWSEHEGGEVWCDNGYPRLMQRPLEIALTGKMSKRCVCMQEEDLEQPSLEVYEGCNYYAKACKV